MASLVLNVAELIVVADLLPPRHSELLQELPPNLSETTAFTDSSKPWFLGYGTTLGLYTEGPTVTPLERSPWLIVGLPAAQPPPLHRCCLGGTGNNEPKFYDVFTFPLTTEDTRWSSQVFWNVPKHATGDLLVLDSISDDNPHFEGGNRFSFTTSRLRTGDVMVEHLLSRPSCEVVLTRLVHLWRNRTECHAKRWNNNTVVLWKDTTDTEAFVRWLGTHATLCSGKCRWWLSGV